VEFFSSGIGRGPVPWPSIEIRTGMPDGNLIPTSSAAFEPVNFASLGEEAFKTTLRLLSGLESDIPGDRFNMSEAIAIHNLDFGFSS
jgi:hypothetical protein